MSIRLLAVPGSLRAGSHNANLLRAAAHVLPPGVAMRTWDGVRVLPPFDEDVETDPPTAVVAAALAAIAQADALLVATPEYNGSLPGVLKNALDWASRPYATNVLRDKPVAVVGASTGPFGAVWAQADARRTLTAIGADVVDAELAVGSADVAFGPDGALVEPAHVAQLTDIIDALVLRTGPTERRKRVRQRASSHR